MFVCVCGSVHEPPFLRGGGLVAHVNRINFTLVKCFANVYIVGILIAFRPKAERDRD